jgi:hypothetical protein
MQANLAHYLAHFVNGRLRLASAEAFRASQEMFDLLQELTCDGAYGHEWRAK